MNIYEATGCGFIILFALLGAASFLFLAYEGWLSLKGTHEVGKYLEESGTREALVPDSLKDFVPGIRR